jgi:hypothetical protein
VVGDYDSRRGTCEVLGRDKLRACRAIALALIVVSGLLTLSHPARIVAEEQPVYSPRATLAWPGQTDARHAHNRPLTAFDGRLAARVYLARQTTSVAIYDPASNSVYSGGDAGPVAGASLSKVLMAVIALQQAEQRGASESEIAGMRALIFPTIAYSDNDYANDIWALIGRRDGVVAFANQTGLTGFSAPHPWDWGQVSATARDWAILFAMLGGGELLNESNTSALLAMMDSVIEDHRWGVLTRREDSISYGKNGWYMDEDGPLTWRVNSAGFVSVAEPDAKLTPRVVVVLTRYPAEEGMSYGVDFATHFTDKVIACTHTQQARTTLRQQTEGCTTERQSAAIMEIVRRVH